MHNGHSACGHNHGSCNESSHAHNESLVEYLLNSVNGPWRSLKGTYNLLSTKFGISDTEIFNATALPLASASVSHVMFLVTKKITLGLVGSFHEVIKSNTSLNANPNFIYQLVLVGAIAYGLKVWSEYCQKNAALQLTVLGLSKYSKNNYENVDTKDLPFNLLKVNENAVHYLFALTSSLFTFAVGIYQIQASKTGYMMPILFVSSTLILNVLINELVHKKMEETRVAATHTLNDVEGKVKAKGNGINEAINNMAKNVSINGLMESLQGNMMYIAENYLYKAVSFLCLAKFAEGVAGLDFGNIVDGLDNLSFPFLEHLEHGRDVAHDHDRRKQIEKAFPSPFSEEQMDQLGKLMLAQRAYQRQIHDVRAAGRVLDAM